MPATSTRRRNQPQRNYKEEDPDDLSLTEDSDALDSGEDEENEEQESNGGSFAYDDADEFDMEEEEKVPRARGGGRNRKPLPAKRQPASSSRSIAASNKGKAKQSVPAPIRPAAAASSSRSRRPPVNYIEDDDDEDDSMDEEDEEEEEEEEVVQDTRGRSRRSPAKQQESSPLSSGEEEDDQDIDMEEEEIDLEDDAGDLEEEDIDVGIDDEEQEEEEEDDEEEEDEDEEEEEDEESAATTPIARKGASGGRPKGKGRASTGKGEVAKTEFTEDEFSDDDFSTPQLGMGFGGNLTKRQRSKLDGNEALSYDLLELPSAASRKRHKTEEELALKKSELSRRRKNMTAQRAEQDKIDTINRLLKKQAGKRKKGGGDDEEGATGEAGTGDRRDRDAEKIRKVRYPIPPTYLRTIYRVEGTTLSIPECSLDIVPEWVRESIQEPSGIKRLVAVSAAAEAEASGQLTHLVAKSEEGKEGTEASGAGATSTAGEPVKVHRPIEILNEPLLPPKAPTYPAPRSSCVVEGCAQTWKYRGVKSKKQVCGLEHLRLVENGSS